MKVSFHETREVGGPTRVGVQGRFKCQPTRERLIAGTPEYVHNPAFYMDTDTQGRANIYLSETDPTWLWAISFESALGGWGPVYVAVNAAPTGNWPELPHIDPDTLEPEPDPAPLWTAAVEAVKLYATESATAMTAAQEAQRLAEIAARAKVVRTVNGTAPDVLGNVNVTGGGGGGTTDHGQLTGLADDDHPQYHNNARGDARYSPLGHNHTGTYAPALGANDNYVTDTEKLKLTNLSGTNTGDQDLSGYSPTTHNHAGTYAPALGANDNYVTDTEKLKLANLSGTNTGDQDLSGYSPTSHTHDDRYYTETESDARFATAAQGVIADKAVGGVQTVNARTAAYTLVAGDVGKLVTMTLSAAGALTVPANVVTVPAGTVVRVDVLDLGTARVTFVQGSGMTLTGAPTLVSSARYAGFSVIFTSATTATVVGALASA